MPYVVEPEGVTPGVAQWYATAVTFEGYAQPVLGKTFAGRPVKLEGNPDHPASGGSTDLFTQAALLGLYDPERSASPRRRGAPVPWTAAEAMLTSLGGRSSTSAGEGLRIVTGPVTSPTLIRQMKGLLDQWPRAKWYRGAPLGRESDTAASLAVFGRAFELRPDLTHAQAVVCLDHDLLGPGPFQNVTARAFGSARRRRREGGEAFRLFVAEPAPTATGAMADRRRAVEPHAIHGLLYGIAAAIGVEGASKIRLDGRNQQFVEEAAAALRQAGGRGLLLLGGRHGPELLALALRINDKLGSLGKTLLPLEPATMPLVSKENGLEALARDLERREAQDILFLGVNPVYTMPGLAELLARARLTVHAGLHLDETAEVCSWHLPLQHELETWSDALAPDQSAVIIQPLVSPFLNVRSAHQVLALLGGETGGARGIVQKTWRMRWADSFGRRWQEALLTGLAEKARAPVSPLPPLHRSRLSEMPSRRDKGPETLTLTIAPDPTVWDGSLSENAWLQETPKPMNKVTWGNVLTVSPALAEERGLRNGDEVIISAGERRQVAAIWIQPGQAARTLALTLGYGRRAGSTKGLGTDAYALMSQPGHFLVQDVRIAKTGDEQTVASTQLHQAMEGHEFVRTEPLERKASDAAGNQKNEAQPSFYPPWPEGSPSWGMSIDLDTCIGCNACVAACVAENNVPMVGKDLVAEGREMHWLRIDQYQSGPPEDPDFFFQPVPCMHCEQAPCEMGCPVNAAVHSRDGLNLQVYNRCIGTRTCSSFCPYKVRRFNWFDYTQEDAETLQAMRNPDVTVRMRGVMEKCTYCVQRIEKTRIEARKQDRPIRDGEIVTACQQVCPVEAIRFGDVTDPGSGVSRDKAESRNYVLLEEVNTRPRTSYLARLVEAGDPEEAS